MRLRRWSGTAALVCLLASLFAFLASPPAAADDLDVSGRLKLALVVAPLPHGLPSEDAAKITELVQSALEVTGKFIVLGRTEDSQLNEADRRRVTACHQDADCLGSVWASLGAEVIARLEVSWVRGHMDLTLVAKRLPGGTELGRAEQPVGPGGSLVIAADDLAHAISAAAGGPSRAPVSADNPPRPASSIVAPGVVRPRSKTAPDRWSEKLRSNDSPGADARRLWVVGGLEFGGGPWSADPARIIAGSKNGFDFDHYATVFSASIDQQWRAAMNVHFGLRFLGFGGFEAAIQTSGWNPGQPGAGGAILAGVRAALYPLEFFLPERNWDLGVELGGGYAFVGASNYDMDGSYFMLGITGEYYVTPLFSVGAYYRLFTPFLFRFYVDYGKGVAEGVNGFTAYWNTLGVSATLHFPVVL